jgi:MscS family membrane protein
MAEDSPSVKDIIESRERSEVLAEQIKESSPDIRPGETPLSALIALQEAVNSKNWQVASQFMDTRYLPPELQQRDPVELLQELVIVWDQHRILDLSELSQRPEGHQHDGLPSYRDLIGKIPLDGDTIPIYLQRVPDDHGNLTWKISNASVRQIPLLWDEYGFNPTISRLAEFLPDFHILDMENWQLIGLILMVIAAWGTTYLVRQLTLALLEKSSRYKETLHRFFSFPFRWFLFFILLQWGVSELGLSLKARVYINTTALGYIAYTFLILAAIEFAAALFLSNSNNNQYWSGIIRPIRTVFKILAVIAVSLSWLADAGYNISTILAGLGIGSLAIALAAQKTLENVIGAFTLYIAQPVRPGDFCSFGETTGMVEEIGLRSTRIRRLDRTVVHVPNSVMVAANLENISETDRRRYHKLLRLSLKTNTDQLRLALLQIREMILSHPRITDTATRVRFQDIERDAYVVAVNCYVDCHDFEDFMAVVEDLNLRTVKILEQLGVQLAIPELKVEMLDTDQDLNTKQTEAREKIEELLRENNLAFPDHSEVRKSELKGSISYPELGNG